MSELRDRGACLKVGGGVAEGGGGGMAQELFHAGRLDFIRTEVKERLSFNKLEGFLLWKFQVKINIYIFRHNHMLRKMQL
jgi:hypothetical protein